MEPTMMDAAYEGCSSPLYSTSRCDPRYPGKVVGSGCRRSEAV